MLRPLVTVIFALGLLLAVESRYAPAQSKTADVAKPVPLPGLEPLQRELSAKAMNLAQKTEQAQQAKQVESETHRKLEQARAALRAVQQEPPRPGATAAELRQREARKEEQQQQVGQLQAEVTEKTLAAAKVENDRRQAVTALEQFQRANPNVKLPATHEAAVKLRSLGIKLGDIASLRQLREVQRWQPRYDMPPGSGKPPVDLRPDRTREPLPPDPRADQQRQQLEAAAAAIRKEGERLATLRQDLERRKAELAGQIARHNANKPNPTNALAVDSYNAAGDFLNTKKAALEAEIGRWNSARTELLDRVSQHDRRVMPLQQK